MPNTVYVHETKWQIFFSKRWWSQIHHLKKTRDSQVKMLQNSNLFMLFWRGEMETGQPALDLHFHIQAHLIKKLTIGAISGFEC